MSPLYGQRRLPWCKREVAEALPMTHPDRFHRGHPCQSTLNSQSLFNALTRVTGRSTYESTTTYTYINGTNNIKTVNRDGSLTGFAYDHRGRQVGTFKLPRPNPEPIPGELGPVLRTVRVYENN